MDNRLRIFLAVLVAAAAGFTVWKWQVGPDQTDVAEKPAGDPIVTVTLPDSFSSSAIVGKRVFDAKCASCHGENAVGQNGVAPPLIHIIYEPNHHGDEAFQRAASMGAKAHHWPFGDMPPVEGVSRADISDVIAYIREIQRVNGIE